jgi:hypothetical protein
MSTNTETGTLTEDSLQFLAVVKEMDKYAVQMWVDKRMWYLTGGRTNYSLVVTLEEDCATVAAYGWGSCQPLIAKTPNELRECINCWWRNR